MFSKLRAFLFVARNNINLMRRDWNAYWDEVDAECLNSNIEFTERYLNNNLNTKLESFGDDVPFKRFQKVKVVLEAHIIDIEDGIILDDGTRIYQLVGKLPSGEKIYFMPESIIE